MLSLLAFIGWALAAVALAWLALWLIPRLRRRRLKALLELLTSGYLRLLTGLCRIETPVILFSTALILFVSATGLLSFGSEDYPTYCADNRNWSCLVDNAHRAGTLFAPGADWHFMSDQELTLDVEDIRQRTQRLEESLERLTGHSADQGVASSTENEDNPPTVSEPVAASPVEWGWGVQSLRVIMPFFALFSVIIVLVNRAGWWLHRVAMPKWSHTVVAGLGEAGAILASQWNVLRDGPVVFIDRAPVPAVAKAVRKSGIPVIIGDVLSDDLTLRRAGLINADRLVCLLPDDGHNIQLSLSAQRVIVDDAAKRSIEDRPTVYVHVDSPQMITRLEYYEKISHLSQVDVRFLNLYTFAATQLFLDYPPAMFADIQGQDRVHLVIYGFGYMGRALLIEAVRHCHFRNTRKPVISVIDSNPERAIKVIDREFPEIDKCAEVRVFDYEMLTNGLNLAALRTAKMKRRWGAQGQPESIVFDPAVTAHLFCFDDQTAALALALSLREQLLEQRGNNAPIFVRMKRKDGLAALLASHQNTPEIPDGLYPFGTLETVLSPSAVRDRRIDTLAQGIHFVYEFKAAGEAKSWSSLDDTHRRSSQRAALHGFSKMMALGIDVRPRVNTHFARQQPRMLTDDEREVLARMEHERWSASLRMAGYRSGNIRADTLKHHSGLVDWDSLQSNDKAKNNMQIEALPALMRMDRDELKLVVERYADPTDDNGYAWNEAVAQKIVAEADELSLSVRRIHRIGLIGDPEIHADGPPGMPKRALPDAALSMIAAAAQEARLNGHEVHLASTLITAAERAAVKAASLAGGWPIAHMADWRESSLPAPFWAPRLTVLMPVPYELLADHDFALRRRPGDAALPPLPDKGSAAYDLVLKARERLKKQEKARLDRWSSEIASAREDFARLVGQEEARYVEMPMVFGTGLELDGNNRPAAARQRRWELFRAQWLLTLMSMQRSCDQVFWLTAMPEAQLWLDALRADHEAAARQALAPAEGALIKVHDLPAQWPPERFQIMRLTAA